MKNRNKQRKVKIKNVPVELHGVLYNAMFRRYYRKDKFDRVNYPLIDTECIISSVDESKVGIDKYHRLYSGIAKQSHLDRYDKLIGIKMAYARALKEFSKVDRTVFWENFKALYMQHILMEQKV